MASSTLSLTVDKGPKTGEALSCKPGTLIRIGRLLRGNTLAIKDPGISQKHLTVSFLHEISRWVITDHGSSNGTYVNGSLISPDEPFLLSEGDVIKIGESTSITVNISAPVNESLVIRRCGRHSKEVKIEEKEWEENVDARWKYGPRATVGVKRGRGSASRVSRKNEGLESVKVEPRVTRSMARGGSVRVFVKKPKDEDALMISNSEFVDVMGKEKESKVNCAGVEEDLVDVYGEDNSRVEEVENNMEEELLAVGGEDKSSVEEVEDNMVNLSKEDNAGAGKEMLTVFGKNNTKKVEEVEDNMNNMTLEEWFDRMEDYLPKSISKVAEEIICKLREKAQFFDEYVIQTSNAIVE